MSPCNSLTSKLNNHRVHRGHREKQQLSVCSEVDFPFFDSSQAVVGWGRGRNEWAGRLMGWREREVKQSLKSWNQNLNKPYTLIKSNSSPSKSASFPATRVALRWFAVAAAKASASGMLWIAFSFPASLHRSLSIIS